MSKKSVPTLREAFETYLEDRIDLRKGSRIAYANAFKRVYPEIADKSIDEIKCSELKRMYMKMRFEQNYSARSIELVNNVINPVFDMAVEDEIIAKNPNSKALHSTARGDAWRKERRSSVREEDKEKFLKHIHESEIYRRWENIFIFLFGTGCRVGETIGLKWENVDFETGTIVIDHTLQYINKEFVWGPPKSGSGYRTIPMIPDVRAALERERAKAMATQIETEDNIPGVKGFVFRNNRGKIFYPSSVNQAIKSIVTEYNDAHPDTPITDFTSVHQTRHSFATMLCENDVNLKVIQSVMGHADIATTMDIYTDVSEAKKKRELEALGEKISGKK